MQLKSIIGPAIILLVFLVLFFPILTTNGLLLTTDNNFGEVALVHNLLPTGFIENWNAQSLLGGPTDFTPSWNLLLCTLLPPVIFNRFYHFITLYLAAVFLFLFLRTFKLTLPSCVLGGLVYTILGSNCTLIFAGHVAKFSILMFAALFLFFIRKAVNDH